MPDRSPLRPYLATGVAIAGLIAVTPPPPGVQVRAIQLTSVDATDTADSPLGGGTALIVGGSGYPTPSQGYADAYDALYLQPHGFTGTTQVLTTPESLYPFTLPFSETFDKSTAQGVQDIVNAVHKLIDAGGVDAANPVVVTGYSQGATLDTLAMSQLAADGVPSDDVHFVSLGDPNAPNGGMLERFDLPAGTHPEAPSLGLTFSGATPSDLYPADIYTYEYDGFVDFPKYPIDILSTLNAYLGIVFNHVGYLGLTPEQITPVADGGDAIQLPTSAADTLTNYYMIPSASLPLLDPLRLVPFAGNPLADLLQPDLRVLVNLGYGSIDNGWSPGDADVPTTIGFLPPQDVLDQVPQALMNGVQQGLHDAFADLMNPSNYQLVSPQTMSEVVGPLLGTVTAAGGLNDPSDFSNWISAELKGIENWFTQGFQELSLTHTGIPPIDMGGTVLFTLPQIAENVFETQMAAGNPVDAIGDPLATIVGLAPLLLIGAVI